MEFPVKTWHDAISLRHACRHYNREDLSPELAARLQQIINELSTVHRGVRIELVEESPDPVLKGFIGSYGKIKGASAYAALIGDTREPHIEEKVGYLGECFILEATANYLDTCWVGGTYKPDAVSRIVKAESWEEVLAVAPIGKGLSTEVVKHKRKPFDSLWVGLPKKEWPPWVEGALEAARLAPSAYNRQPWRFTVEKEGILISVDSQKQSRPSKRLDCGISMLHLEIGALSRGVEGTWEYLSSPDIARFTAVSD